MAKRSINEVYNILNKKRENALNDRDRERNKPICDIVVLERLYGEIEAYTDIIILLETSGLVEDEQVDNEEAFKELFLK